MPVKLERESPFLIKPIPGFDPVIGHLVSMMSYARETTLHAVQGLTVEQLDHLCDEQANSIGMLLEHIACVEEAYQQHSFELPFEAEALARIQLGLELGPAGQQEIRGVALERYLERLDAVRQRTLAELARRDDAWLFEEEPWWGDQPANNYYKWFHVFEDELSHRGQIRILRKRLPGA